MSSSPSLTTYLQNLQRFGIAPGLERIRALLERAGNPQHQYPIVLVGGTNGKGSTCEFLARMLQKSGKKVGLYTSPHLYAWNERIRVLDTDSFAKQSELFPGAISETALDALLAQALPHTEAVAESPLGQPTEFEVLTLLGLWQFARERVDVAVVEVGLGGRWDATNITRPTVSVITHVALDHCDRLGDTLAEIARDKIEIARPHRTLVTAEDNPEVLRVFEEYCQKRQVRLRKVALPEENSSQTPENFQQINLETARAAYQELYASLKWPKAEEVSLPPSVTGRFETIREAPRVILDSANNPDGAAVLAAQLQSTLENSPKSTLKGSPAARLILVLGILQDKDYAAMTALLAPLAERVFATESDSPRAAPAQLIAKEARKFCENVQQSTSVAEAVQEALKAASKDDIVCITGSFYTVAEADRKEIQDFILPTFSGG